MAALASAGRRSVAILTVLAVIIGGCATAQRSPGDGPGSSADVTAIQALLRARADAIGRGDLQAFLATIDPARPTLRRTEQELFADPQAIALSRSTFKVSAPTTYLGYTRAFVERVLEGAAFAGAFGGAPANVRTYFRKDGGRWLLSEPTTDELGGERRSAVGDVDVTYWGADEDLANLYVAEAQAAHDFALRNGPGSVEFKYGLTVIPTAAVAGPGWTASIGTTTQPNRTRIFPGNLGLDPATRELSAYTRFQLRATAIDQLRDAALPGVGARLTSHRWLPDGFVLSVTGLDLAATIRQACAGTPPPTLRQLNDGPPPFGTPGVSAADVGGRFYAYASALTAYLLETFKNDGYWRLLRAINEGGVGGTPAAFTRALGISEEALYAAAIARANKRYC